MKKIIFCLMHLFIFTQIANATEYLCPASSYKDNSGKIIHVSEVRYNPSINDCERWNSDFFKQNNPRLYQYCLEDRQFREQQMRRGECKQVN